MVPPLTQSKALPPRDWVSGMLCPSPSSYFRLSHLVVLGVLPASCAISTQPGCPCPQPPRGQPGGLVLVGFGGEGPSCLLSLSALVLPAVWMVLPHPHVFGVRLSFFGFFTLMRLAQSLPPPPPRPSPRTAVNLSVVINTAALLPASASAVSLIKRGGPSLPLALLVLWEDSGGQVDRDWAPGCE